MFLKLASPETIKTIIKKHNFHFSKKLGQNFLKEQGIVDQIVAGASLDSQDLVVEVGPGIGSLTAALANTEAFVLGVELDRNLLPMLAETLRDFNNVSIVHGDILKVDINELLASQGKDLTGTKYKVVANLPYCITTPVIFHLLEHRANLELMVVMVQKEVAQRIVAKPGGKDYGALSVAVQYYAKAELLFTVPKTAFIPEPEVESAVLRLTIRDKPAVEVLNEKLFFQVVRGAFGQRRKTLLNALVNASLGQDKVAMEAVLAEAQIDPSRRGETLSLEEFAKISDLLSQAAVKEHH